MNNLEKMEIKIHLLRDRMYRLIEEKSKLVDPEVVDISQELDKLLNMYNEIQRQQPKK